MFLWGYFCPKTLPAAQSTASTPESNVPRSTSTPAVIVQGEDPPNAFRNEEIFTGYVSDQTIDDEDSDGGDRADDEGDNSTPLDNVPTAGYTSAAIEEVPDDVDAPIALTRVVPSQEISSFGIAERKRRSSAIEHSIPQPKRLKLEISVRARRQREKTDLFCTRLDALL